MKAEFKVTKLYICCKTSNYISEKKYRYSDKRIF